MFPVLQRAPCSVCTEGLLLGSIRPVPRQNTITNRFNTAATRTYSDMVALPLSLSFPLPNSTLERFRDSCSQIQYCFISFGLIWLVTGAYAPSQISGLAYLRHVLNRFSASQLVAANEFYMYRCDGRRRDADQSRYHLVFSGLVKAR